MKFAVYVLWKCLKSGWILLFKGCMNPEYIAESFPLFQGLKSYNFCKISTLYKKHHAHWGRSWNKHSFLLLTPPFVLSIMSFCMTETMIFALCDSCDSEADIWSSVYDVKWNITSPFHFVFMGFFSGGFLLDFNVSLFTCTYEYPLI